MLSGNRISYVVCHVPTLRLFGISKICTFDEALKRCLINSTPRIELSLGLVIWKGHVQGSYKLSSIISVYKKKQG